MLRVSDCVGDSVSIAIPQPTEGKRIGNQINTAMIFMQELTKSAKPVGVWAGSQLWILKGERFGL
jgi:hypothetical protein